MKTQDNKQQVISYLEKTSNHTFSFEDGKIFKVIKELDKFYFIDDNYSINKKREINIDYYIKHYNENAKCVIKHILFLNRKVKSIKTNKFTIDTINSIVENQKIIA